MTNKKITEEEKDDILLKIDFKMFVFEEKLESFDDDYMFYRMHYNTIKSPKEYAEKLNKKNKVMQSNVDFLINKCKNWLKEYSDNMIKKRLEEYIKKTQKEKTKLERKMIVFS